MVTSYYWLINVFNNFVVYIAVILESNSMKKELIEFSFNQKEEVLVAQSSLGLCAVFLGNDFEHLVTMLKLQFPWAKLQEKKSLSTTFSLRNGHTEVDLRGTPFQKSVWKIIKSIPTGQTLTYGQIAEKLGKPKSSRAVARCCGQNPLAIIIPCHRVVRKDGKPSGFRWGMARKERLLRLERAVF